jgi:hypothetical protein
MKRDRGLVGFLERWRSSAIGLRPVLSAELLGVRRLEVERDLRESGAPLEIPAEAESWVVGSRMALVFIVMDLSAGFMEA